MSTVYIIEDNDLIRKGIKEYFEISGFDVYDFAVLSKVREAFSRVMPDVIILDVMLPDGNGFVFAKELRRNYNIPILFLTAKEQESDRIMGFEVGGDDYVVKPFSNKELLLRVKALLKRVNKGKDETSESDITEFTIGPQKLIIDRSARKVYVDETETHLTMTEWNILTFLSDHYGQAVSRDTLLSECLGYMYSGSERSVDTHIANLRNQLGETDWIETIRGFGYRFVGEPVNQNRK